MKQKLLTLLVLLVSALTAFADAEGSGTAYDDSRKNSVSFDYTFTEADGAVIFTITSVDVSNVLNNANDGNNVFIWDKTDIFKEHAGKTVTWTGVDAGKVIKVQIMWPVAGGQAKSDEITYTVATVATPDTEKPVMAKAEATNIFDTKATLTLNATDDRNGTLTYKVTIGENSYTTTGSAGKDATIDITGLTAETKYDFSVTATDKAGNVSDAKTGTFTTAKALTLTAPDAPTVDANKVISVLSGAYTAATTWGFGTWGQATVAENVTVDGAPMIHLSKFNYIGLDGFANQLDLSGMTHMHFDVLPITMTGALGVTPILASEALKEHSTKVGDANTFKAQQWNAVDIALSDFGLDFINNKVFQIKFDQGNSATDELYIANIYFYNNSVGEQTLKSISLSNSFTGAKSTLTTTVSPVASDGTAFSGEISYTISNGAHLTADGNNLTITADAEGTYTLTATCGEHTATAIVGFVGSTASPTDAAADVLAYYSDTYGVDLAAVKVYDKGWEKGWEKGWVSSTEINLTESDKAMLVTGVGTWGLSFKNDATDVTLYTKLCADVYAIEEAPIALNYEGTSVVAYTGTLKKGWNHIELPFGDAARTSAGWVKFNIGNDAKHDYTVIFDNIYLSKEGLGFSVTTTGNIAKVVGPVTTANVEQINSADVMNIDLTGVTSIEDGVTIQPKRKNAIIIATGSVTEGVYSADSKFDPIKDMANVVVLVNGYYHPLKQLEFVDIPGEPLWTGIRELNDFISTGSTGWKVTRTIKAGAHASVCVIMAIVNIPEGLSAWEAVDYDETVGLKFSKTNVIGGNFPYIVRNTADHDIDLSFTGAGDINFKSYVNNEANKKQVGSTNIWFCGNWKEALVTDGTQWIVKNDGIHASVVKANGTKISPFRAYFTGIPEGASAKLNFIDGEATGINGVNAEAAADGAIYNLAGQKVSAAYKGIVIKNGKKYLMK